MGVVFLCMRFVWGRIVSVSEGVSGKKSVLLVNALPCANTKSGRVLKRTQGKLYFAAQRLFFLRVRVFDLIRFFNVIGAKSL